MNGPACNIRWQYVREHPVVLCQRQATQRLAGDSSSSDHNSWGKLNSLGIGINLNRRASKEHRFFNTKLTS